MQQHFCKVTFEKYQIPAMHVGRKYFENAFEQKPFKIVKINILTKYMLPNLVM